jgi:hypothetical protein
MDDMDDSEGSRSESPALVDVELVGRCPRCPRGIFFTKVAVGIVAVVGIVVAFASLSSLSTNK